MGYNFSIFSIISISITVFILAFVFKPVCSFGTCRPAEIFYGASPDTILYGIFMFCLLLTGLFLYELHGLIKYFQGYGFQSYSKYPGELVPPLKAKPADRQQLLIISLAGTVVPGTILFMLFLNCLVLFNRL